MRAAAICRTLLALALTLSALPALPRAARAATATQSAAAAPRGPAVSCLSAKVEPLPGRLTLDPHANTAGLDGQPIPLTDPIHLADGRTFVPVRWVAELAGYWVTHDLASGRVQLSGSAGQVTLDPHTGAVWEGEQAAGQVPVRLEGTRLLVHVRPLARWLGAQVHYDPTTGRVTLAGRWMGVVADLPAAVPDPSLPLCVQNYPGWSLETEVAEMPQVLNAGRRPEQPGVTWVDLAPGPNTLTLVARGGVHRDLVRRWTRTVESQASPADYPVRYQSLHPAWYCGTDPVPVPGESLRITSPTHGYTQASEPLAVAGWLDPSLGWESLTLLLQRGDERREISVPVADGRFAARLLPILGPGVYAVTVKSPPVFCVVTPHGGARIAEELATWVVHWTEAEPERPSWSRKVFGP